VTAPAALPRLGFLGLGWIGRHRLRALEFSGAARAAVLVDPSAEALEAAQPLAPHATLARSADALVDASLDGLVIATPSGLHAEQAVAALERGLNVFCQKPLATTGPDAQRVVDAARAADRLLGVDFCYRHLRAVQAVTTLVADGTLGTIYAVEAVFHNAYGPSGAWCRDPRQAGGGCVLDLGVHLLDLGLGMLGFPAVRGVHSRLYADGRRWQPTSGAVEDFAVAALDLESGATLRLSCSWWQPIGRGCEIVLAVHGSAGGAAIRNVDGSFVDFRAERYVGDRTELLVEPPDDWGGRAAVEWARQLTGPAGFTAEVQHHADIAAVVDRVYQACEC
jgi:predicted dehydrogenase